MLDINPEMLQEGKKRFAQTMYHNSAFPFRETNSPRLPLPPGRNLYDARVPVSVLGAGVIEDAHRNVAGSACDVEALEPKKRFAQTMYHNSAFPFRETNSPRLPLPPGRNLYALVFLSPYLVRA
jgi:uncharacterized protein YozE (UPF0346 family)